MSPLLLSSRPSSLVMLRSVFRSRAFDAQLEELLATATKQVLAMHCIRSHRQDCWAVGRRWAFGRRNSLPFLSTFSADSRAGEKAACVYAELLIRMHHDSGRTSSVSGRLREALSPAYFFSVLGSPRPWGEEAPGGPPLAPGAPPQGLGGPLGPQGAPSLGEEAPGDSDAAATNSSRSWSHRALSSGRGAPSGSPSGASASERLLGIAHRLTGRLTARRPLHWAPRKLQQQQQQQHRVSSNVEVAYNFYADPAPIDPLVLFGDDSTGTLHLNLGLSMLAPHKTSAVYVHVAGDMGAPENYAENVDYYLDAFSLTRFSADSGVEVPVYTLEFDIGVEGDHESVLALVASLTTAASRVSSSQLQAAAEESSDSSKGEARRVRWVSLGAFKPLHAVGKALSRFVLAHVLQYRACKQQQQQREEAGADSDKARSPRLAAQLQQQPRTALRLQQLQQQLAAVGLSGCHLPLLILKPRYVVQRHRRQDSSKSKSKQQTGGQARSNQELNVQILPLLPHAETMEKNKKQKYTGPTARPLQYDSAQMQVLKPPMSQGFPVILFRTPVHALTQSWLVGIVDRPDVFRGATKTVQEVRSFLPVAHPSRFVLYKDMHEDFLHMLSLTASPDELLPPPVYSAALLLHLLRLRDAPASSPGAAAARTPDFDAAECQRRLLPVQLDLGAVQMEASAVPCPGGIPDCLPFSELQQLQQLQRLQREQPPVAPARGQRGHDPHQRLSKPYGDAQQQQQQQQQRRAEGPRRLPLGATEPPWGTVRSLVGPLLRPVSPDVLGRIEQAATDLSSFFCSRLPFVQFMDVASAPELAEFTVGLSSKLHVLRREVLAAVMSAEEKRGGPPWRGWGPPNLKGALDWRRPEKRRRTAGPLDGPSWLGEGSESRAAAAAATADTSFRMDPREGVPLSESSEARKLEGTKGMGEATGSQDLRSGARWGPRETSRGPAAYAPFWQRQGRLGSSKFAGRRARGRSSRKQGEGPLGSRGALEVVDVQLQMQRQLLEISAGLAADLLDSEYKGPPESSPEELLQLLPELQRQADLEKEWPQNFLDNAKRTYEEDSRFAYYARQTERRQALTEVVRFKAKETADFALSLMDAAEWLHSLKEEGRTPRSVFPTVYPGAAGPLHATAAASAAATAAAVAAAAAGAAAHGRAEALLHYYTPPDSDADPVRLRNAAVGAPEVEETLRDAEMCVPQKFLEHFGYRFSSSSPPAAAAPSGKAGLPAREARGSDGSVPSSSSSSSRSSRSSSKKSSSRSSRDAGGSAHRKQSGSPGKQPLASEHTKGATLWWEEEAALLMNSSGNALAATLTLAPHLHLALQTGRDWDCLGVDSVAGNALWLYVMGRICANSFVCEGFRSLLFGETLLLQDLLKVAKRNASGTGKALCLSRIDLLLEGRHQGFARTYYARQQLGRLWRFFSSGSNARFPQRLFLSCTTEWQMAVEVLTWVQSHPNCFMRHALP
ncbi:hypothetical protein, conserved [Eimeria tenella]|uniref:Uncharacterized protein n=1 Tax=Eimeria tenella TaxID=5802 RepID=U6L2H9_EIMTE|nr:hypothetical protein, conserved [Eimeria tenella]CDJ42819.1 hypothetical protein, conserved [Eimeria tenella]|eukprot:XP_013233569.1 hypothetical protein, conserved [Eimeria tenella]